jgi:hypothetical protein
MQYAMCILYANYFELSNCTHYYGELIRKTKYEQELHYKWNKFGYVKECTNPNRLSIFVQEIYCIWYNNKVRK